MTFGKWNMDPAINDLRIETLNVFFEKSKKVMVF